MSVEIIDLCVYVVTEIEPADPMLVSTGVDLEAQVTREHDLELQVQTEQEHDIFLFLTGEEC